MKRLVVIGSSGSGKSTVSARAAHRVAVPHIELDALYWSPNWVPRPAADFRGDVDPALLARSEYAHLKTYRLRSPRQVEAWLFALNQPGNTPVDK